MIEELLPDRSRNFMEVIAREFVAKTHNYCRYLLEALEAINYVN